MAQFKKISNDRGELFYDRESNVAYGWSFISNASGAAFSRAHGTTGIYFYIKANDREVVRERIDTARVMSEARPVARKYIRETGKAQAEAVAEAALINRLV
jgi:hypothetical protein